MSGSSIASRPSLEQVVAIVDFMEEHPALGLGQLRGLEGREESKKLWFKLTRLVNAIDGPIRPTKSWIKFWADKKSQVRSKVLSTGGNSNILTSNIEKKIWDLFLANDNSNESNKKSRRSIKKEADYIEQPYLNDDTFDDNHVDSEPLLASDEQSMDVDERHMTIMEKLVGVMGTQAVALTDMGRASQLNARAMERLADAATVQAGALERLANSFEQLTSAASDIRTALLGIDETIRRYNQPPT